MSGPHDWTQSPFGRSGRLDGVDLDDLGVVPLDKQPAQAAVPYQTAEGGTGYQIHLVDGTGKFSGIVHAYRWPLTLQARTESNWYHLRTVSMRGAAVTWIDFDYEIDVWTAGEELSEFTLTRSPAETSWGAFPTLEYPKKAYLNSVEQTVVSGSSPGAGEVALSGRTLTTPTLSAGDILSLRYVPVYLVVVSELPRSLSAFNDLTTNAELREVLSL